MTPRRTTLLRAATIAGASAVLVAAGVVIADDDTPPAAPAAAPVEAPDPVDDGSEGFGLSSDALPRELLEDLAALPDLPAGERAAALSALRERAEGGDYGDVAARAAARVPDLEDLGADATLPTSLDLGGLGEVDLSGVDLSGVDLRDGIDLGDVDLSGIDVSGVELPGGLGAFVDGLGG